MNIRRTLTAQFPRGIDGETRTGSARLYIRDLKPRCRHRTLSNSEAAHGQAILRRNELRIVRFMRWTCTGYEDDTIVTCFCRNRFGAAEVPVMDRVETAAEVERWHKAARPIVMAFTVWVALRWT